MPADSPAQAAFLAALSKITGTGNFHSEGVAAFFLPEISVKGVGELAFPLPEAQVRELIAAAEVAPYGKGTETVRDAAVRQCWQIDANSLALSSKPWKAFIAGAVEQVRKDLGIEATVSALPYKLLVYEKGGHFLPHRDTEKLEAMFGTLLVALPSAHEGGELRIRHGGREVTIDFSAKAHWRDFQFAALFADCEHEVTPVKAGYRCCLVYNLRLETGDAGSLHLPLDAQAQGLLPSLKSFAEERRGGLSAALLEHGYTEANFSLRNLKGNDSSRARALLAAAEELGLVAHLGLVTYHQTGELVGGDDSYHSYHRYRGRHDDDDEGDDDEGDDGEMGEVYEETLTLGHWRDALDRPVRLGGYAVSPEDLIAGQAIDAGEPDEKESEGYTGNAGCTMDYWYRRAAVVWWQRGDHERILCDHDLSGACRELYALAGKRSKADRAAFDALAAAVVERIPEALSRRNFFARARFLAESPEDRGGVFAPSDAEPPFHLTLAAFARAGAAEWLARLLSRVPCEAFELCPVPLWRALFEAFGGAPFEAVIRDLIDEGADDHRGTLFRLLDAIRDRPQEAATARRLLATLVRLAPAQPDEGWQPVRDPVAAGDPGEARVLLLGSPLIDTPGDRELARAFLFADESLPYVRGVLGPLLQEKVLVTAGKLEGSLYPAVLAFAVKMFIAETGRELKPYPDWARSCPGLAKAKAAAGWIHHRPSSSPGLVEELAGFMADPAAQSHDFRRAQRDRDMLEGYIQGNFLDLDMTTIRKGSPHTLRVTKNDASYRHALSVRDKDEALLALLAKLV